MQGSDDGTRTEGGKTNSGKADGGRGGGKFGANRLFDDVARLMTDAAGAAQGVRREAETVFKAQVERLIRDMDIATREEVDVLRDLVSALRSQNDALAARVAALEAKASTQPGAGASEVV